MSSLAVGVNYVQLFSNINPIKEPLEKYQVSEHRTDYLRDGDVTTCVPVFTTPEMTYVQMKVVISRDYLFKRIFHVDVFTKGWNTCSPTEGVRGIVYLADKVFPCVALEENIQGGTETCRFRCDGRYGLDFVLLEVKRLNDHITDLLHVCEIEMK